jgi:sigma-B regulation protein RsbU (phosphoserine phosphatase)
LCRGTIAHNQDGERDSLADRDRLTRLLGNLVADAMAYGAKDHPVTITSRIGSDTFEIEVYNMGAPIPPDLLCPL